MQYPVDEKVFTEMWLAGLVVPDESDRELAAAIVGAINRAYEAGFRAGKEGVQV